jgi:transposase InsO family protein
MIEAHFAELEAVTSTSAACDLLGVSRATRYRRRRPPVAGPPAPRPAPPNKLTEAERQRVLTVLRSDEYCDLAPAQVWARLLDDGIYLCSISTMYRLLAVAGENRERRRQRIHPATKKPELIATAPNQCWSWDITKLQGPERGVYYELFVIIDVRHEAPSDRVGWKDPPAACRSRSLKLGAARSWERRGGWEQPRRRRDGSALPDDPGLSSKTGRCTRGTSV